MTDKAKRRRKELMSARGMTARQAANAIAAKTRAAREQNGPQRDPTQPILPASVEGSMRTHDTRLTLTQLRWAIEDLPPLETEGAQITVDVNSLALPNLKVAGPHEAPLVPTVSLNFVATGDGWSTRVQVDLEDLELTGVAVADFLQKALGGLAEVHGNEGHMVDATICAVAPGSAESHGPNRGAHTPNAADALETSNTEGSKLGHYANPSWSKDLGTAAAGLVGRARGGQRPRFRPTSIQEVAGGLRETAREFMKPTGLQALAEGLTKNGRVRADSGAGGIQAAAEFRRMVGPAQSGTEWLVERSLEIERMKDRFSSPPSAIDPGASEDEAQEECPPEVDDP